MDITKLNEAELREIAEAGNAIMEPIVKAIIASPTGKLACPLCSADATWMRNGRTWTANCLTCEWDAAGMISTRDTLKS